jgi:hypothetical protein
MLNSPSPEVSSRRLVLRALRPVRALGLLDAALLVVLVAAALRNQDEAVSVLGPLHGVNFLALVVAAALGAVRRRWGWWLPLLVVVTLGPPGSLYGEWRIRRALARASPAEAPTPLGA